MPDLFHIIYTSTHAQTFSEPDIQKLLIDARENNVSHHVTGMLVCLPQSFIQLIEGPAVAIKQLYANIEKDKRHKDVTLLKSGKINRRSFPNWTMALDMDRFKLTEYDEVFHLTNDKIFDFLNLMDAPDDRPL
ncbi:MAG: BLUF domain-containing protein [Bacteroidota bacterium]|nr:BLUF domain-containing protein [Bacteroidota bacterium]